MQLVPGAIESYNKLNVKHEPLRLITPQFETPLPPLQPAVSLNYPVHTIEHYSTGKHCHQNPCQYTSLVGNTTKKRVKYDHSAVPSEHFSIVWTGLWNHVSFDSVWVMLHHVHIQYIYCFIASPTLEAPPFEREKWSGDDLIATPISLFLQVFPPSFRELPHPSLELFDLDEAFSSEKSRLAQVLYLSLFTV